MSLTKLSLGGNNDVIYKLFPPRESLASDILAQDGNIEKLYYAVGAQGEYNMHLAAIQENTLRKRNIPQNNTSLFKLL
jgi:hypothetical protein